MTNLSRKYPALLITSTISILLVQVVSSTLSADEKSFDHLMNQKVVVITPNTRFEVPGKKSQPTKIGDTFRVGQVKDGWLWVNQAGGWIDANAIILANDAEPYFSKRVKDSPSVQAFYQRGMMWSGQQDFGRALVDFEAALRLDPSNSLAQVGRGNCLLIRKFYDRAIDAFTEAIETDQKLAIAYANRANAWQRKGEYQTALRDYAAAAELEPESAIVYNNRGNCYMALGDMDRAVADYNAAINANPQFADAYNNRGYVAYARGNFQSALDDYQKAANYGPDSPKAYNNSAWIRAACPEKKFIDGEKAIKSAKRAMELTNNTRCWYCYGTLAAAYAQIGDFKEAVATQIQVIAALPTDISSRERVEHLRRLDLYLSKKTYTFPHPKAPVSVSSMIPPQILGFAFGGI